MMRIQRRRKLLGMVLASAVMVGVGVLSLPSASAAPKNVKEPDGVLGINSWGARMPAKKHAPSPKDWEKMLNGKRGLWGTVKANCRGDGGGVLFCDLSLKGRVDIRIWKSKDGIRCDVDNCKLILKPRFDTTNFKPSFGTVKGRAQFESGPDSDILESTISCGIAQKYIAFHEYYATYHYEQKLQLTGVAWKDKRANQWVIDTRILKEPVPFTWRYQYAGYEVKAKKLTGPSAGDVITGCKTG